MRGAQNETFLVGWVFFCGHSNFSLYLLNKHNIEILSRLLTVKAVVLLIKCSYQPTHTLHIVRWHVCKRLTNKHLSIVSFSIEIYMLNSTRFVMCQANEWMLSLPPPTHITTMCLLDANACELMKILWFTAHRHSKKDADIAFFHPLARIEFTLFFNHHHWRNSNHSMSQSENVKHRKTFQ